MARSRFRRGAKKDTINVKRLAKVDALQSGKVPTLVLQKQIDNMSKRVKEIQADEELKWSDVFTSATIPSSTGGAAGLLTPLILTVVGDLPLNNREGAMIRATSVQIRIHLIAGSTPTSQYPTEIRTILFWDKQANSGTPTLYTAGPYTGPGSNGLLDNTTVGAALSHSPFNRGSSERFRVLYDKVHVLQSSGESGVPLVKFLTIKKKLGRMVKFTQGAGVGTTADVISNQLWLVFFCSAGSNSASATFGSRVYFKDD